MSLLSQPPVSSMSLYRGSFIFHLMHQMFSNNVPRAVCCLLQAPGCLLLTTSALQKASLFFRLCESGNLVVWPAAFEFCLMCVVRGIIFASLGGKSDLFVWDSPPIKTRDAGTLAVVPLQIVWV